MIAFEFTRIDESLFANEFDQGDISLISENLCITSKLNSKHSNMIYLSIISLTDGLTRNNKYFEFVAADSSFRIKFKQQRETILINHEGILKIKVNRFELLKALEDGVERFLSSPRNSIPFSSAVYLDLSTSRTLLNQKINNHRKL